MATDDERRAVAERLRRAWANVSDKNPVRHHMRVLYEIYAAVGLNDDGVDAIDLFDRLADLIDPDCDEGRYSVARTVRPVDRDALLELADIVRCRDCVHFSDGMIVECERLSGQPYWTDADGFCAWGMPRKRGDRE